MLFKLGALGSGDPEGGVGPLVGVVGRIGVVLINKFLL